MTLSIATLLVHDDTTPEGARAALRAALARPEAERQALLIDAARILFFEGGVDCDDARELVGLPAAEAR
jgi:hypothetical protein